MGFFVKAAVEALKAYPAVNAAINGDEVVYKHYFDIGVAVSTEQGLMVPVLRDADAMSFADIEKAIGELGKRARDGKLTMDDLNGGTFTITNGGIFGSMLCTPILNPPQVGILGMHAIQEAGDGPMTGRSIRPGDVPALSLRPPHHRRPRGGELFGAGQGVHREPRADAARRLKCTQGEWRGDLMPHTLIYHRLGTAGESRHRQIPVKARKLVGLIGSPFRRPAIGGVMNKLLVAVVLPTLMLGTQAAMAASSSGCGLGTQVFEGQTGIVPQVLAVTTNGTSGNQTFGISSGTSGCVQNGTVASPSKMAMFMGENMNKLAMDMSRGQGETLTTLAGLKGVAPADRAHFYAVTQANVGRIFASDDVTVGEALQGLELGAGRGSDPAALRHRVNSPM